MEQKIFIVSQCKNASSTIRTVVHTLFGGKAHSWSGQKMLSHTEIMWEGVWGIVDNHNICSDDPMPIIYQELHEKYPDAKFILSYRNPEDWYESFHEGFNYYWHGKYKLKQFIYPYDLKDTEQKDNFINRYNEINKQIIQYAKKYIPKRNFLTIDIDEMRSQPDNVNWKIFSDFLEIDKNIDKPFPNRRTRNRK